MNRRELEWHLQAYFNGELDASGIETLKSELVSGQEARQLYIDYARLCHALDLRSNPQSWVPDMPMLEET